MRESRESIILAAKAQALRHSTGNELWHTATWPRPNGMWSTLCSGLMRPTKMLCFHKIVQYLAVYQLYLTGILYIILATYSELFTTHYGQSIQTSGLNYIAIGLGLVIANLACTRANDLVCHPMKTHSNKKSLLTSDCASYMPSSRTTTKSVKAGPSFVFPSWLSVRSFSPPAY